jgi:HTH-type transcriptional regulator/antitoxin HipB
VRIHNPTDLGLIIRDRRRTLGLDQAALADRVGVSRQWLVEIERGKPRAEVGLVLRTLAALGLELSADLPDTALVVPTGQPVPDIDIDAVIDVARGRQR